MNTDEESTSKKSIVEQEQKMVLPPEQDLMVIQCQTCEDMPEQSEATEGTEQACKSVCQKDENSNIESDEMLSQQESTKMINEYMEQAMEQAQDVQNKLKVKVRNPQNLLMKQAIPVAAQIPVNQRRDNIGTSSSKSTGEETTPNGGSEVRITGFWRWKTVVVPPNMNIVHTRRGYKRPLHIGLGISFRFNPHIDSFLVIPSAMQTIIINANSICKELQGILIQAYVQWIIDDIEVAYQRLDFSDMEDPMRVVNIQLREQAEAAIKDKVATMSITEVLSDKQPIIKELTKRLKEVAEGSSDDRGLGIRIVTVQIKEAIVSSTELWQNLQRPFRSAQKGKGRLAEIENESLIGNREMEDQKQRQTSELESASALEKLRSQKQAEEFDREQREKVRRHEMEQQAQQKRIEIEASTFQLQQKAQQQTKEQEIISLYQINLLRKEQDFAENKKAAELADATFKLEESKFNAKHRLETLQLESKWELDKKNLSLKALTKAEKLTARLERQRRQNEIKNEQIEREIAFEEKRQKIANIISSERIQSKALEALPEIAKALPRPDKLYSVTVGNDTTNSISLSGMLASILGVFKHYGIKTDTTTEKAEAKKVE